VRVVSECECDPSSKCEVQRRVEKKMVNGIQIDGGRVSDM
jgi:hypothetical protein